MKYIKGQDRRQITFLPDSIEELIGQDNPVRVIDAFVDNLDIEGLGFQKAVPCWTGRLPYDPRDLLKLYVMATSTRSVPAENLWLNVLATSSCFFS